MVEVLLVVVALTAVTGEAEEEKLADLLIIKVPVGLVLLLDANKDLSAGWHRRKSGLDILC